MRGVAAASTAQLPPVSSVLTSSMPSLLEWSELSRAREALRGGADRVVLEGLWGSAKALALTGLLAPERPACVIVAPGVGVVRAVDDLRAFAALAAVKAPGEVVAFPAPHAALWRGGAEREEDAERAALLGRLPPRGAPWGGAPSRRRRPSAASSSRSPSATGWTATPWSSTWPRSATNGWPRSARWGSGASAAASWTSSPPPVRRRSASI